MLTNTRSHYQSQAVQTASPAHLVLMLYDGALAAMTRAGQATAPEAVHRELLKAQDIVTELQVTLDLERGGALASSLAGLYAFCLDRLVEANLTKDLSLLDAVRDTVSGLREAWAEACCAVPAASSA